MNTWKLVLEYDGGRYHGWQRQPGLKNTVQGRVEHVLSQMAGVPVEIDGAGRTDAGVHALGQVASLRLDPAISGERVRSYLDQYLPDDIRLVSVEAAPERFHARLNATGKHYRYRIWNAGHKPVFSRYQVFAVAAPLNLEGMRQAARHFVGTQDFQAFTAQKSKTKGTERRIDKIEVHGRGPEVHVDVWGDGFLHKMVRTLVGTLIEVGEGKLAPDAVPDLLAGRTRSQAGFTAPPQGLYLVEVFYPAVS